MISIIYANRNRDVERIQYSLESLERQSTANFEVVFVDYGSEPALVSQLQEMMKRYDFVKFYPLEVSQLLWNKSKALNFGVKHTISSHIFIADVDLILHPDFVVFLDQLADPAKFFLFKLGYLDESESKKLNTSYSFSDLNPTRIGNSNGMILVSKKAFMEVNGLDEFFHFYGAEDEDLFARLENAGLKREERKEEYFYHNWHRSFLGSEDNLLTTNPRVKNIMRINQSHFERNRERGIIKPLRQQGMGSFISPKKAQALKNPNIKLEISNIHSRIEHFLREELPSRKGEVVQVKFFEDEYYNSLKHKLKKRLGKQTQPYISMKEVNDMILKEILYNYRDHNYCFRIEKKLKSIVFCLEV